MYKIINFTFRSVIFFSLSITLAFTSVFSIAQEEFIEEVVVVGSQIQGAKISEALAVSILSSDDIEIFGIDSGDELLDLFPEIGQNFFSEAENISGGINSARGDIGSINLRNIGTGNTLVLLNGRRLVNSASFQTEEVGGSFVPVNTVNSNTIPVAGVKRTEILRDGASAIYGADAVAGVVNTVLKKEFDGFRVGLRWKEFSNLPRNDQKVTIEWGNSFNGGSTNVNAFFSYFKRGRVNSQDDPKWANSDLRRLIPSDSPWANSTSFRNNSANSGFGQFDVVSSLASTHSLRTNKIVSSSGDFETFPIGDARCKDGFTINTTTCGRYDGQGTYRYDLNDNRDLASKLTRYNFYTSITHEFDSGMESFTELLFYSSNSNLVRHPSAQLSTVKLIMGASNYYNPFGPSTSPNRLADSIIGTSVPTTGLALTLDNYRFTEIPRTVDNTGTTYRLLQGLRGEWNSWNWESALTYSSAKKEDVTHNRISNTLIQQALNDSSSKAYNPFSATNSNIEQALVSVRRDSKSTLFTYDIKLSKIDLFALPAGDVGFAGGLEYRRESFTDDRDPRLDGTINFATSSGTTYPFVSDVVNSSPTADNSGKRSIYSFYGELQVPVFSNLDLQLALRHERFSDVDDPTVGKIAFGYRIVEPLLFRGSYSTSFRAPNLITINESLVSRNNTRNDYTCLYADPDQKTLDCRHSIQRTAQGSKDLKSEKSDNYSLGIVFDPTEEITLTFDYWSIKKKNTIGLFGEENHTVLDLLNRIEAGTANCPTAPTSNSFNSAVERGTASATEAAVYKAAGICAAGDIVRINDKYSNLDDRLVQGYDVGLYTRFPTDFGDFFFKFNVSILSKYDQEASGTSARLVAAKAAGTIPANIPVSGFSDLINKDGNQDYKHNTSLRWSKGAWNASLSWTRLGDFYQSSLTLSDGTRYSIPAFDRYNTTVSYKFTVKGKETRVRFGVQNLANARAPLADRYFGYFADAHNDFGRRFYLDVKLHLQ